VIGPTHVLLGVVFGGLTGLWWRRVHGDDPTARGNLWLAIACGGLSPAGVGLQQTTSGWFSDEVALARVAWPGWLAAVWFVLWVSAVFIGIRTGPMLAAPPKPAPDLHGTMAITVRSFSYGPSLLLAVGSIGLLLPGLVVALYPRLRFGPTTTVRIDGELVELRSTGGLRFERDGSTRLGLRRVGDRVVRRSLAGGAVEERQDLFGTPILRLTGRDGTVDLPLGGTTWPAVHQLRTLLRAATRAPRAPTPAPMPDALAGLRAQARQEER
jgi:hypothetical protein